MRKALLLIIIVAALFASVAQAQAEEISRPIPLWPIIYHKATDGIAETDVLFRSFYHERKDTWSTYGSRPFYILPLFSTEADTAKDFRKTSVLWRLSLYKRERDRTRFHVFPLVWHKKTPEKSYSVVFPLYWAGAGEGYSYTHLWPLYGRQERGSYREYGTLYPLIRFGRDPVNDVELNHFLLYYHRRERADSFTTFFPLYGRKVEGPEKKTWFIPLYYSRSDVDSLTTFALPLVPYYHRKEPGSDTLHLWPLYSRREEGTYREYGTLYPLIRFGRDPKQDVELDQFLIYYHRRERDRSITNIFPLYWSKAEGAKKRQVLIPLYYHREDEDSLFTFAPLYYERREPGLNTVYVWPFYRWYEEGTYREHGVLYPLIRFGRDSKQDYVLDQFLLYYNERERDKSFTTFFPLYWNTAEGAKKQQLLIPVYYHREDKDLLVTLALPVFPYYHRKEPGRDTLHVWPLYSRREEGTYLEYGALYPFIRFGRDRVQDVELDHFLIYYHRRERDRSITNVFPLYWSKADGPKKRQLLIPLYYHREDEDSLFTLAPLYYHRREPGTNTVYVWPFYRWHEEGTYTEHGVLYPLVRFGRDPKRDFALDHFLLYYHKRERDRSFTTVFPLFWSEAEGAKKRQVLIPVYFHREDEDSLLTLALPLLPYYHRKAPGRDTVHLWPLYGRREKGTYREHGALWPLIRFGRDPERDIALDQFLLFYHKRDRDRSFTTVFPLWFSSRRPEAEWDLLLPVYYGRKTPDQSIRIIAPLYYQRETPLISVRTLIPLYYSKSEPGEHSRYIFPTYISSVTRTSKLRTFIPLYMQYDSPTVNFTAITPLFMKRKTAEGSFTTLLPLYYDYQREDFGVTLGLPVYLRYRSAAFTFTTVFPLYYRSEDKERRTGFTYYFPFYGEYRRGETVSRHFLLFPLYSRFTDEELQMSGWDVLWPLFHYESSPTTRSVRIPPFYWHGSTPGNSYTVVFPLYWSFVSGEDSYRHLIPFYGVHRKGDWYRKSFVFGPLYMDMRDDHAGVSQQDALLWLYSRRVEGDNKLSWLFPVYYHREHADSLLTLALPVLPYYHRRVPGREKLVVFPVYSMRKEETYTEHASFWPLIRFGRDPEKDIVLDHFLIYYHKRERDRSTTNVFPLYWSKADGAKKWQLLIPLYYHREDKDSLFTLALPVLPYYHRREPGSEKLVVFPVYSMRKEGTYTEHASFWPLIRFGRDPVRDVELDHFLLYYHKRERDRSITNVFPLYWSKAEGAKKRQLLIPLYYHREDEDSLITFAPLYYHRREPGLNTVYVWPFYRWHEEGTYSEHGILWPLIRFGRDRKQDVVLDHFLLYYHKRERDRSFTTFFPLYWSTAEGARRQQLFIPLYYHREDEDSLITFAPLYYHRREPGLNTVYVWPFYRRHEEGTYTEHGVLWPLIRFGRDPKQDVALDHFLIYYHMRERDQSITNVFPLYWSKTEGAKKRQLLIPLYYHREDEDSLFTFAPLYYHRKEPGTDTVYVWPFYRRHEEGTYTEHGVLYPFIRFGRDPVQDVELDHFLIYYHKRERDRSITNVFPLYWSKAEGAKKRQLLIPVYYHREDEDSLFTFAPLYYHRKEPGTDTVYVWPFYRRHEEGTYLEHGVLYPFIRFGRDPVRDVELDHFLLYYHKRERTASFSTVFPLWWHKEDEYSRRDATILLHWYERDVNRDETNLSLLWLIPPKLSLFRYHREAGASHHRLFPLYSYSHDRERDAVRWSVLWFVLSHRSEGEFKQETAFLWKVISYEREDANTYDFRFLWRFIRKSQTATSSTFEFNPLYYHEEEEGKGSYWAILGGLIGMETTPDQRKKLRLFWIF